MDDYSKPHFENPINYCGTSKNIKFLEKFFNTKIDDLINNYPIKSYLINSAPWRMKWLDEFIHTIRCLENNNIFILKDKLKDEKKFREGLIFLYNYKCYHENNCTIDFILEDNQNKIVDIKITDHIYNHFLFIECTEIKESTEMDTYHTFTTINKKSHEQSEKYDLLYVGEILIEYIAHPDEILSEISKTAKLAFDEGYSTFVNDKIKIAFSKREKIDLLKCFANENKISFVPSSSPNDKKIFLAIGKKISNTEPNTIMTNTGITPTIDESFCSFLKSPQFSTSPIRDKIRSKIESKRQQIKKSKINKNDKSINALFIESMDFFRTDFEYTSTLIEQYLEKQGSIDLLIIYEGSINKISNEKREINKNIYYICQTFDVISHQIIIIKNARSQHHDKTNYFYNLLQDVYHNKTLLH